MNKLQGIFQSSALYKYLLSMLFNQQEFSVTWKKYLVPKVHFSETFLDIRENSYH